MYPWILPTPSPAEIATYRVTRSFIVWQAPARKTQWITWAPRSSWYPLLLQKHWAVKWKGKNYSSAQNTDDEKWHEWNKRLCMLHVRIIRVCNPLLLRQQLQQRHAQNSPRRRQDHRFTNTFISRSRRSSLQPGIIISSPDWLRRANNYGGLRSRGISISKISYYIAEAKSLDCKPLKTPIRIFHGLTEVTGYRRVDSSFEERDPLYSWTKQKKRKENWHSLPPHSIHWSAKRLSFLAKQ